MRVQSQILIPGEHFTSPNAGRSEHSEQREECSGRGDSCPHGPPPEFARFAHEFDLPALGEVKGRGTHPPHFCHSNASAPAGAQDVDSLREGHPPRFPKVRMGTLGTLLCERAPARLVGERGYCARENEDQDAVVIAGARRDVVQIFTSPIAGRSETFELALEAREKGSGWADRRWGKPPTRNASAALRHFNLPRVGGGEAKPSGEGRCDTDFNDQNVVEALT